MSKIRINLKRAVYLAMLSAFWGMLAFHSLPARAQTASEGINLQVSPLPISLNTLPGTVVSTDLRIRNAGSKTEKLQVRLLKVSADDNGTVRLGEPGVTDEWAKWVSFSRPVFDAPPGEWQTITMTVNVPKTAAFGYYFAVEYSRAATEAAQSGKAVTRGAVATFILLNAESAGAVREAQVVTFSADKKFYEFLPAGFTAKIQATGNVHVAPHGNIFITRGSKQVDVININASQGNILPHSSRFFTSEWDNGFPAYTAQTKDGQPVLTKAGKPVKSLKWDIAHANRLRFGHYTAHLVMVYDNGQRDVPIEATVQFWVIPWRVIGIGLFVAAFVGIGLFATVRSVVKKVRRKK